MGSTLLKGSPKTFSDMEARLYLPTIIIILPATCMLTCLHANAKTIFPHLDQAPPSDPHTRINFVIDTEKCTFEKEIREQFKELAMCIQRIVDLINC